MARAPKKQDTAYAGRNRDMLPEEDYDCYHYVNRDIYSRNPPGRKKRGPIRRFFRFLFILCLLAVLAVGGYSAWLYFQLERQPTNTSSYVEQPENAPNWEIASRKDVFNLLLIGADRNRDDSNGRSDTMMLVSIDRTNRKLRLVSFLRDMYLDIPTVGYERLNAAFAYGGAALTMQTIENYFRVEIDKYMQTDFENFEKIIEQMGGVDVELSQEEADFMNTEKGWELQAGVQHLNAEEALFFSRIRNLDSDFGRTGRQRQMVLCMIDTFMQLPVSQKLTTLSGYLPYVTTNLSYTDLLSLGLLAVQYSEYEVETMYIPDAGTYEPIEVELNGVSGNQVLQPDIEENARRLRVFLYGEEMAE